MERLRLSYRRFGALKVFGIVFLIAVVTAGYAGAVSASSAAITVWHTMSIDDTWDARTSSESIVFSGLKDALQEDPFVSLVWKRETKGWFVTWSLTLESADERVTFHTHRTPPQSSMPLATSLPSPGHTYKAVMSYDGEQGVLAVRIDDETERTTIVKRSVIVSPADAPLSLQSSPYVLHQFPVVSRSVERVFRFTPVALQWDIVKSEDDFTLPIDVLPVDQDVEVRLHLPKGKAPGRFSLSTRQGDKVNLVYEQVGVFAEEAFSISSKHIPNGAFALILQYEQDGYTLMHEVMDVSKGRVETSLRELTIDQNTGRFSGSYVIEADFPIDEADVRLDVHMTQRAWDATQGRYVERQPETVPLVNQTMVLKKGENVVAFSGEVPRLEFSVWRFQFDPFVKPSHPVRLVVRSDERAVNVAPGLVGCTVDVMSFNIRFPSSGDGVNVWDNRRSLAVQVIHDYLPHIIGFQEPYRSQLDHLDEDLIGYDRVFVRPSERGGVHNALYYDPQRLTRLDWGRYWLSDEPDTPFSSTWGNNEPRAVLWAKFRLEASGQSFYVLNTHFHHRDPDGTIGKKSARLLLDRLSDLEEDLPIILVGDFNVRPTSDVYDMFVGSTGGFIDAWEQTPVRKGPEGTFHAFTGEGRGRIDWILVKNGVRVTSMEHVATRRGAVHPSDHFPIAASVCIGE